MKDFFTYLALFSVATILVFLLRGLYLKNLSIQNKKNAGKNLKKQKTANGGLGFVRLQPKVSNRSKAYKFLRQQSIPKMLQQDNK